MLGNPGQHGTEIRLRIVAVELGRADQGVDCRRAFATPIGTREQVILATARNARSAALLSISRQPSPQYRVSAVQRVRA